MEITWTLEKLYHIKTLANTCDNLISGTWVVLNVPILGYKHILPLACSKTVLNNIRTDKTMPQLGIK